jgi:hypothetical protein
MSPSRRRRHVCCGDIIFYTYPSATVPHHVVIYQTRQNFGYGLLSEFHSQIATVRQLRRSLAE